VVSGVKFWTELSARWTGVKSCKGWRGELEICHERSMWLLVEVCPLLISVGSQRTRAAFRALGFDAPIPR
jgi:hypothetical protein